MTTVRDIQLLVPKKMYSKCIDAIGNDINIGSYVIWQPYTSAVGMRLGKVVSISNNSWGYRCCIKSVNSDDTQTKTITRLPCELISYFPLVMHTEQYKNEIHLEV